MKMVMKRTLNGFNLKLKSSSDVGILGDSRQRKIKLGDMQRS